MNVNNQFIATCGSSQRWVVKMWRKISVAFVILCLQSTFANKTEEIPCKLQDTVDISSGSQDISGNFHHEGTVYQNGTFTEVNYILQNLTNKIQVETQVRGCICKYKPCIRICCSLSNGNICEKPETLKVQTKQGDERIIDLNGRDYGVLMGRPCKDMYLLEPKDYDYDRWYFLVSFSLI